MKTSIVIKFELEGFHFYPDAPEQVEFLKNNHRHLFGFKLYFEVKELDREQEFFILQGKVKQYLFSTYQANSTGGLIFGQRSCEMIAVDLLKQFNDLEYQCYKVEVWEDWENGAIAEL